MNILLLGDIVGPSGRKAVIDKLPNLKKKKKIDFVIANGENAADQGVGITKKITEELFCDFLCFNSFFTIFGGFETFIEI